MADLIQEQATTYTPGENDLVYNTVVTMGSYSSPQPVVIKQYDSLPIIAAKMRKDGNDYQVPDGAAVNIRLHKRSGTFIYSSVKGISQDRKTAYIQLTSNMTAVYGRTMPCLEIVVNGSVACTGDMVWDIQRNPVQEDDVKDTSEGQYIQEMAAQVQAFEDAYQEALDYMNNATNQSRINNAASNAQAAQQAATNAANSADEAEEEANRAATESAKALGFRSFYGGQVVPGATDGDLDPSRPMSTPTAASVTIKARGDRIAGLTMAGKTTQAGTGDPSPENIRMIGGVGVCDQMVILDGTEKWRGFNSQTPAAYAGILYCDLAVPIDSKNAKLFSDRYDGQIGYVMSPSGMNVGACCIVPVPSTGNRRFCVRPASTVLDIDEFKSHLSAHPLTVWYRSTNYAKSTGPFYTVVELSQDPYRAVGFELNQPLFDGDSLKVGGKSGFDKMIVLDGSEDEDWAWNGSGNTAYAACSNCINIGAVSSPVGYVVSDTFNTVTLSGSNTIIGLRGWEKSLYLRDPSKFTSESTLRSYLQSHPLTVCYKSVNYTEENDVPVVLEKHNAYKQILNGDFPFEERGDLSANLFILNAQPGANGVPAPKSALCVCDTYKGVETSWAGIPDNGIQTITNYIGFKDTRYSSVEEAKQGLNENPITIVYELATPVSYARPVPTMIAQPGEDGTFQVKGENNLSVKLKPFQDGGNAARLDGHTWDDIMAAIDQKIASLASTVMEVN